MKSNDPVAQSSAMFDVKVYRVKFISIDNGAAIILTRTSPDVVMRCPTIVTYF